MTTRTVCVVLTGVVALGAPAAARDRPYLRDPARVAAMRRGWTAEARDRARAKWRRYLETSDETLWAMLPGPNVIRAMGVNRTEGCPKCGQAAYKAGGLWPFKCDIWARPWKVTCPSCAAVFPTNDFAAFHKSGLGPDGLFDPNRADRKLLFNAEHPAPDDRLRAFGVDDGRGWVDAKGHRYWFVARYCSHLWTRATRDVRAMADDYQRTGAPELAHKAAVLLTRMADMHPQMNFTKQGVHPGSYRLGGDRGKVLWACGPYSEAARMRDLLHTYDACGKPLTATPSWSRSSRARPAGSAGPSGPRRPTPCASTSKTT